MVCTGRQPQSRQVAQTTWPAPRNKPFRRHSHASGLVSDVEEDVMKDVIKKGVVVLGVKEMERIVGCGGGLPDGTFPPDQINL